MSGASRDGHYAAFQLKIRKRKHMLHISETSGHCLSSSDATCMEKGVVCSPPMIPTRRRTLDMVSPRLEEVSRSIRKNAFLLSKANRIVNFRNNDTAGKRRPSPIDEKRPTKKPNLMFRTDCRHNEQERDLLLQYARLVIVGSQNVSVDDIPNIPNISRDFKNYDFRLERSLLQPSEKTIEEQITDDPMDVDDETVASFRPILEGSSPNDSVKDQPAYQDDKTTLVKSSITLKGGVKDQPACAKNQMIQSKGSSATSSSLPTKQALSSDQSIGLKVGSSNCKTEMNENAISLESFSREKVLEDFSNDQTLENAKEDQTNLKDAECGSFLMTTLEVAKTMLMMKEADDSPIECIQSKEVTFVGTTNTVNNNQNLFSSEPTHIESPVEDHAVLIEARVNDTVSLNPLKSRNEQERDSDTATKALYDIGEQDITKQKCEAACSLTSQGSELCSRHEIMINRGLEHIQNLESEIEELKSKFNGTHRQFTSDVKSSIALNSALQLEVQQLQKSIQSLRDELTSKYDTDNAFQLYQMFTVMKKDFQESKREIEFLKRNIGKLDLSLHQLGMEKANAQEKARKFERIADKNSRQAKILLKKAFEQVSGAENEAFRLQKVLQDEVNQKNTLLSQVSKVRRAIFEAASQTDCWEKDISNRLSELDKKLKRLENHRLKIENKVKSRRISKSRVLSNQQTSDRTVRVNDSCIVCFSNPISIVFVPCGHRSVCPECAPKILKCPLCRKQITCKVKSFDAGVSSLA